MSPPPTNPDAAPTSATLPADLHGKVDYALVVAVEEVRYQGDFSSSHWLFQVIAIYLTGLTSPLRREAFERVLRTAGRAGVAAARRVAAEYPPAARFPEFVQLGGDDEQWAEVKRQVHADLPTYLRNRFSFLFYRREGD